jgi:phenylalanyl-tRNA synthetase beta chain
MNVSRRWLEAFLRRPLEPRDLASRLAMLGVTCDAIEPLHPGLDQVVVGFVESVRPHPNADRLRLCEVNDGTDTRLHVVCGAPNVTAGKKYPFARIGVTLPGGVTLSRRAIRGETSEGMLCSAKELGLGQEHDGILELDTDAAPGTPLPSALPLADERLVLDVSPNRPDLLGHKGIARELAWSYAVPFRLPEIPGAPASGPGSLRRVESARATIGGVTVGTDDPEGCPRFTALVIRGVKVGPSPGWLKARLEAVGLRSINNVVDATNYVMLELNHPMHAYDLSELAGPEVVARRARAGERVITLDGVRRELTTGMTVIADAKRVIGVGGVMGAENTEVRDTTTDLVVECAFFDPPRVRRTRKALNLVTDASHRFERGVDRWGLPEAQRRCAELILATAGGTLEDAVDVWPRPVHPPRIFLRPARAASVLGAELPVASIEKHLVAIGCTALNKPDDARLAVDVPGWRPDLTSEIDLIEEIARLHGYDSFPTDLRPFHVGRIGVEPMERAIREVRDGLTAVGLYEAHTMPLVPEDGEGGIRLRNPLSADESWLRQALLPGLQRAVITNWSRQTRDVRLFETGTVFRQNERGARPIETIRVGAVITGARAPAHWIEGGKAVDFDRWDLKSLFGTAVALAYPEASIQVDRNAWIATAPDGRAVGRAERLSLDQPPWAADVYGFELDVSAAPRSVPRYAALPTTPAAWRDVNLVLGPGIAAERVIAVMQRVGGSLLETVDVVSEFRTERLGQGRRAVQFRLVFRAPDRTIRDEEVDQAVTRLIATLEKELDAKLRTT